MSSFETRSPHPPQFSSSHQSSFLDMSPSYQTTGPAAYAADGYRAGITPPDSPALSPYQSVDHHEALDYALSSDQLESIVTGIRQLPTPSRSSGGGPERYSDFTEEDRRRRYPQIRPDPALNAALREKFPSVQGPVVIAIANHRLQADELHKLDSDLTRRGNDGRVKGTSIEEYPELQNLIDPLTTYFRILLASRTNLHELQRLADVSQQYISHLIALAATYEWAAVLAYHFDFYRVRMREMKDGNYSGWAQVDAELHARHLTSRERSRFAADRTTSTGGR